MTPLPPCTATGSRKVSTLLQSDAGNLASDSAGISIAVPRKWIVVRLVSNVAG
jgi:hypothetical protein